MTEHAAAFSIPSAAKYLSISRAGIYRLIKSGELRPAKVGHRTLILRRDADALLERAGDVGVAIKVDSENSVVAAGIWD